MAIRQGSHGVYDTRYHQAPKYRKWVLQGAIGECVRELFGEIAAHHGFEMEEVGVDKDQVQASWTASRQKSVVSVLESRHANTRRLAQSRTAHKYTKPRGIGITLTRSIPISCASWRSVARITCGRQTSPTSRWRVCGLRYTASIPMRLIRVATCRRPIAWPSLRKRFRSICAPANG